MKKNSGIPNSMTEEEEKTIDLENLGHHTTRLSPKRDDLVPKPPNFGAYQGLNTGDFKGKKFDKEKTFQIIVKGFTTGASLNILKIDRFTLDVYSVTPNKISLFARSPLPKELKSHIIEKEGENYYQSGELKLDFVNLTLHVRIKRPKSLKQEIYSFKLDQNSAKITTESRLTSLERNGGSAYLRQSMGSTAITTQKQNAYTIKLMKNTKKISQTKWKMF